MGTPTARLQVLSCPPERAVETEEEDLPARLSGRGLARPLLQQWPPRWFESWLLKLPPEPVSTSVQESKKVKKRLKSAVCKAALSLCYRSSCIVQTLSFSSDFDATTVWSNGVSSYHRKPIQGMKIAYLVFNSLELASG